MTRAKVAVIQVKPQTILEDVQRLMEMADYQNYLPKDKDVILKNNISWHLMYPSANTTPWQYEGVYRVLRKAGYGNIVTVENETVVTNAKKGERLNNFTTVNNTYNIPIKYNFNPADMQWVVYQPKGQMLVLDKIFKDGIRIPNYFFGRSTLHLPTVKCHIYSQMTGALKNAFGGLLPNQRHYCHSEIHKTLIDLLTIQKEICPGLFCVTDGTTAGNGPGPRTMIPTVKNVMLASGDMVAIDAVAAKLMGMDPMSVEKIRVGHEQGIGVGRIDEIEIVGDVDVKKENWNFYVGNNFASSVGKFIWFGPLHKLQRLFFHTPLVNFFIWASAVYHDRVWYPFKGRRHVNKWLKTTEWGALFQQYGRKTLASPDDLPKS